MDKNVFLVNRYGKYELKSEPDYVDNPVHSGLKEYTV